MRKAVVLSVLFMSVFAIASETDTNQPELKLTLDATYTSKWLSKGVEGYGSQGGVFETFDLDFYQTGFGVKVTHRSATGSGFVDSQRFDYRPYFKGSLFDGESYATDFNLSVGYEHYYGRSRTKANTTYEWVLAFAWPQLLGNNLVPKYIAHYEYPATSKGPYNYVAGWVHRFILDYNINVEQLPKPVKFSSEVAYYDGLGGKGHDWAYATFGLSTAFKLKDDLTCVPGLYHQVTMDDRISTKKDITYTMVSMKYAF